VTPSIIDDTEVQLWWASCAAAARELPPQLEILDDEERRRADRIRVTAARHRFVAARALTRRALGHFLETSPKEIRFSYGERGKPLLAHPLGDPPLHFNLAHSGDTAVVAVAREVLGVDVEALRPMPSAGRLARRFCSADERRWLAERPADQLGPSFLALWTCKEAYLKAEGIGVGMPLREVSVDPDAARIRSIPTDRGNADRWTLLRTELPEPALCCVAIRGGEWRLVVREFSWRAGL
jgi:4'-phosphopantetheinyl transferase